MIKTGNYRSDGLCWSAARQSFNQSSGGGSDLCFFQFLCGSVVSDIYPQFYRILDQKLLSTEEAKAAIGDVDVVFTALPNGLVFEIAEIAMEKGTKIVDFSADFRLDDPAVYEEWYKTKHTAPQLVSRQVYGLPELWRQDPERTARGQSGMLYDSQHPGRLCSPERGTGG